jgi:phenol hydroxylase P0 protein|tara:strand:- start:40 stop:318 length:279 start_codon:yes stop_codon:yes gene_type:complete
MTYTQKHPAGIKGQRYVRVTNVLRGKFVEFEFAIDDPTINVELVLPFEHFRKFCEDNKAQHLSVEQEAAVEYDKLKWRFGVPGCDEDHANQQ